MKIAKPRFTFVIPYLVLAALALSGAYFASGRSSDLFSLNLSDLLLLLLTFPWYGLFTALMRLGAVESNVVITLGELGCLAINAAILYYLGVKFERAPDRLT